MIGGGVCWEAHFFGSTTSLQPSQHTPLYVACVPNLHSVSCLEWAARHTCDIKWWQSSRNPSWPISDSCYFPSLHTPTNTKIKNTLPLNSQCEQTSGKQNTKQNNHQEKTREQERKTWQSVPYFNHTGCRVRNTAI